MGLHVPIMKNNRPQISLRTLMAAMVGLLVAIALGFVILEYRNSYVAWRNAELMDERNRLAVTSLQAVDNFFAERGRGLVYLLGGAPITDQHRAFLDERRKVVDELIARTLSLVTENGQARAAEVKKKWEDVREFRPFLDHALARPQERRDPLISGQWLVMSNELVVALLALTREMTDYPAVDDAGFEHLNNLRLSAVLFRSMVAAESSVYAVNSLSSRALSAAEVTTLRLMRTQSMIVWDGLENGLHGSGDPQAMASVEKIRAVLLDELRPRQDDILQAAERGLFMRDQVPQLQSYVRMSLSALDAVGDFTGEINRLADNYTRHSVEQARRQERLALSGILGILFLAVLLFLFFHYRIARPLQAIQRNIDNLIEKQSGNAFPAAPEAVGNELDRMNFALKLLDEAIQARISSDQSRYEQERFSASILAAVPQAIIAADRHGVISLFSPGAETMLGYSAGEMIGRQTPLVFHDLDELQRRASELSAELGFTVEAGFQAFIAKAQATGLPDEHEWTYVCKDGRRLTVLLSVTVFNDAQGDILCCGVASDITQRSQLAAEMSRLANLDPLTELPNRRLFHDRIRMAITQARRENTFLALMMIDLDRFKPVNDHYGHSVGDLLLSAVAVRMQKCLRESDTLARVGGDEFVVILPMVGGIQDAAGVAEKIRLSLCAPFDLAGNITVNIDCSIGVAIYPDHGNNEEVLLNSADNAMYLAKSLGRSQVYVSGGAMGSGMIRMEPERAGLPVPNLVWRRSYQCGDPVIDREHKDLFMHSNTLIRAVANGRIPLDKLPEMLDELIDSVAAHFRNEEYILLRYGYAELESHGEKHQRLIERALELRSMAVAGELALADVVSFIARDVVAEHMLADDRDYFPLLRETLRRDAPESK